MKKVTWRTKPKIINTIPKDSSKYIMFIDESGEGNQKTLKKAVDNKKAEEAYLSRNDLFILNGVVLSGYTHSILEQRFNKLKFKLTEDGCFNYNRKGIRPINLRNHDIGAKTPPFNNPSNSFYSEIDKIISSTDYTQICAGFNYYMISNNKKYIDNEKCSPLLMALGVMIINYAEYLNNLNVKGIIIFEEETEKHDKLKLNYIKKVLSKGTKNYQADFFKNITAVYFRKKWTEEKKGEFHTTAGLELADLTISPLRRILHPEYQLIERKFFNYPNYLYKGLTLIK